MDRYLSSRVSKPQPKDSEYEKVKEPWFQKVSGVGKKKPQPEEDDEMFDEEEESPGFFAKIKSLFSSDDTADEEFEEGLSDDVIEIIKLQHQWLERLPSDVKREFRNSDDYKRYKEALQRYNLIKT